MRLSERLFATLKWNEAGRGLERPAYVLLSRIAVDGPFRLSTLAADVSLDLSTVSRQVAALEQAGLVRRAQDPSDRRASLVEITELGTEVFTENRDRWIATWQELLAGWTPEERQIFAALFTQLNQSLAERLPGTTSERDAR
ncbi:MarR family transcriptional regulator [Dactylosporangium sp. AC04546]|uniref:MarR family winged helix-turn-helix transcriptional regulator n=1 Tax=Dactylosporangium sp. AC04546 TaxID=2862460 RepID=UPI002104A1BE|nr:MarR family transcriptional regulator [Dactylosporangium sp. AC04546]WVK84491.1 MarR family transcriptional regulator [Dactylosporangium sp. AC04546]